MKDVYLLYGTLLIAHFCVNEYLVAFVAFKGCYNWISLKERKKNTLTLILCVCLSFVGRYMVGKKQHKYRQNFPRLRWYMNRKCTYFIFDIICRSHICSIQKKKKNFHHPYFPIFHYIRLFILVYFFLYISWKYFAHICSNLSLLFILYQMRWHDTSPV